MDDETVPRAEGREKIARWATFCTALIGEDPANFARLERGLEVLTNASVTAYPALMEGEAVTISPELDEAMSPLSDQTQQQYLDLTVDVLLTGVDGPRPTSGVLNQALRTLVTEIARAAHIDNVFQIAQNN